MKKIYLFCLLLLCNFVNLIGAANAETLKHETLASLHKAYVRATIPGTSISSAYMDISNHSANAISLIKVTSDISPRIEIHQHTMVDGMMRMRKVNSIDIEPNGRVKLQPSGLHLMVFDLNNPLKPQQEIKLTLHFSNNDTLTASLPVYSPAQEKAAQDSGPSMHEHHH